MKAKQLRPDARLCVCSAPVKVPGVPHRVCHEPCTELPGEGEAVSALPAVGRQQLQLQIGKCRQKPCSLCLWQCQLSEMIRSYHKYHCFKAISALGLLHSASHSHWSPLQITLFVYVFSVSQQESTWRIKGTNKHHTYKLKIRLVL